MPPTAELKQRATGWPNGRKKRSRQRYVLQKVKIQTGTWSASTTALKGRDRIKEKVCGMIKESNFSREQAVSLVPDAIRYTFQYQEARYTKGVLADVSGA